MTTKYFLDEEKIVAGHFDNGQIEHYTKGLGSRLEAIIYLWAYNNFFTCTADVAKDNGRPMYRELARTFSKLLCVKEPYENIVQKDLHNIDDIQYPLRHDKTAYELQVELNRLREENAKMFNLLEMVARGITLYCDTEDVIKITSDVKKFCIAKHGSEGK